MKMLKGLKAIILLLVGMLAFGCGKDDPEPEKICRVIKRIIVGPTPTTDVVTDYIYNAGGKVVRVNYNEPHPDPFHVELIYNSSGTLIETRSYGDGLDKSLRTKRLYSYNSNGLPETVKDVVISVTNGADTVGYNIYEYNSDKKLIKNSYFVTKQNKILGYNTYSYHAANQIIESSYSNRSTGNAILNWTITRHYDDKKNPLTSLGYFSEDVLKSSNNIVYESSIHPQGITIAYTYNAEGYPVDAVYDFHDSNSFHEKWEYNCQ